MLSQSCLYCSVSLLVDECQLLSCSCPCRRSCCPSPNFLPVCQSFACSSWSCPVFVSVCHYCACRSCSPSPVYVAKRHSFFSSDHVVPVLSLLLSVSVQLAANQFPFLSSLLKVKTCNAFVGESQSFASNPYFPCPFFAVECHSGDCRSVFPVLYLLLSLILLFTPNHIPLLTFLLRVTLVFSDLVLIFLSLLLSLSLVLEDHVEPVFVAECLLCFHVILSLSCLYC
jgi:hypothetical protein